MAAANIPVEGDELARAVRTGKVRLEAAASARVDVLELYCSQCRRPYDDVADMACIVALEGNEHLRGGPPSTERRRRKCEAHQMLYTSCQHLHEEPITYGRPPMPATPVAQTG